MVLKWVLLTTRVFWKMMCVIICFNPYFLWNFCFKKLLKINDFCHLFIYLFIYYIENNNIIYILQNTIQHTTTPGDTCGGE